MEQGSINKSVLLIMDGENYLVIKEGNSFLEQLKLTMDTEKDKFFDQKMFEEVTSDTGALEVLNEGFSGILFLNSDECTLDAGAFYDANKVFEENKSMDDEIDEMFGSKENFQQEISQKFREKFQKTKPYVRPYGKISNNDTCPCGSGKKYKKCCKNDKKFDSNTGKYTDEHNKFVPAEAPIDGKTGLDFE